MTTPQRPPGAYIQSGLDTITIKKLSKELTPMSYARTTVSLLSAVRAARLLRDPELTPEALDKRRTAARQAALSKARAEMAPILERSKKAFDAARTSATQDLSGPMTTDALTARKFAWERVEKLLASGRKLPDLIAESDETTARAIAEWAPSHIRANDTLRQGEIRHGEPDTNWITDHAIQRLAAVASDPTPFARVFEAHKEAQIANAYESVLRDLERGANGPSIDSKHKLFAVDPEGASEVQAAQ